MWENFKELIAMKKTQMMVAGVLVAIGAKLGLHMDTDMVALIVALFAALIGAQGLSDHGKVAAQITADSHATDATPAGPSQIVNVSAKAGSTEVDKAVGGGLSTTTTTTTIPTIPTISENK